ncbi:MAG: YceI family protein, partial [Crocinitomicaceae bacterium]|nr:YceI family protein [Crocinitomicaceae bacterium]
ASPLIAISLVLIQLYKVEEPEINISKVESAKAELEVEKVKLLDILDLEGDFVFDSKQSKVHFSLGKEGETKGEFKKVSGAIVMADPIEKSKLNVVLSLEDFTTRNSFRDKSLMSDEYFNQKKFPEITYVANSIRPKGEKTFEVTGEFQMLGVSKEVIVTMQQRESDKGIMLIGKGMLDRTVFGMAPSSSEGNVVTFNYEVVLK